MLRTLPRPHPRPLSQRERGEMHDPLLVHRGSSAAKPPLPGSPAVERPAKGRSPVWIGPPLSARTSRLSNTRGGARGWRISRRGKRGEGRGRSATDSCRPHPRPLSQRERGESCRPHPRPLSRKRARGESCRPHPRPLSRKRARGESCRPHPRPLSQRERGVLVLHQSLVFRLSYFFPFPISATVSARIRSRAGRRTAAAENSTTRVDCCAAARPWPRPTGAVRRSNSGDSRDF